MTITNHAVPRSDSQPFTVGLRAKRTMANDVIRHDLSCHSTRNLLRTSGHRFIGRIALLSSFDLEIARTA